MWIQYGAALLCQQFFLNVRYCVPSEYLADAGAKQVRSKPAIAFEILMSRRVVAVLDLPFWPMLDAVLLASLISGAPCLQTRRPTTRRGASRAQGPTTATSTATLAIGMLLHLKERATAVSWRSSGPTRTMSTFMITKTV